MNISIAPSILSADFSRLEEEIKAVEAAGADIIHVDVMDGHFVPNLTIGPMIVKAVRKATRLPLDVHLMIEHPESFVDAFADAGGDIITIHAETGYHLFRTIDLIKSRGKKAGVALNPATPSRCAQEAADRDRPPPCHDRQPGIRGPGLHPFDDQKIGHARRMLDAAGRADRRWRSTAASRRRTRGWWRRRVRPSWSWGPRYSKAAITGRR